MDIRMKMFRYLVALLSMGTAFAQQPSTSPTNATNRPAQAVAETAPAPDPDQLMHIGGDI